MLSGRPLLDNDVDNALVVNRDAELDALERAVELQFNVLLTGVAGAGRTTLLHLLGRRLRLRRRHADRVRTVYARVEAAADANDVIDAVTIAAGGDVASTAGVRFEDSLSRLADALAGLGRVVIFVDDVPGVAGHSVFGTGRDWLWELPVTWVVSVREQHAATLVLPPADAFFERRIGLPALTEAQALELVRLRAPELGSHWIPAALKATSATPRAILDAARAVASGASPDRLASAWSDRAAALVALGRPAMMMAAALETVAAAAASDPELLDQLGWTRARAVQVLNQMHRAGLLSAEQVHTGRGRPRKVFRLIAP